MQNDLALAASLFARITNRLPEIYLAVALLVCISLSLLTPPLWVADESNHGQREMEIGHGEWMAKRTQLGTGAPEDVNFLQLMDTIEAIHERVGARTEATHIRPDHLIAEAQLAPLRGIRWAHTRVFSSFQNTAVYPPLLYLPQALALRLGEAADLTIVHSLLLARLCATLCALALGWLALRLCGSWRWLLFAYLLIPTLLNLEASCSQDALLLPAAALAMVLLSRAIARRRSLSVLELMLSSVLLAACIGGRLPYLPLVLVLLLPTLDVPGPLQWRLLVPAALAIVMIVAAIATWQGMVHPLGVCSSAEANPAAQVALLRAQPVKGVLRLVEGTARFLPPTLLTGAGLMGGNDVFPGRILYGALLLFLAGVAWFAPWEGLLYRRTRVILGLSLLGVVAGISLAEYIIWTPLGVARIEGLQARYYLPLLPFVLFLLPRAGSRIGRTVRVLDRRWRERLLLGSAAALVVVVLAMPWAAANRIYHLGLGQALSASVRP